MTCKHNVTRLFRGIYKNGSVLVHELCICCGVNVRPHQMSIPHRLIKVPIDSLPIAFDHRLKLAPQQNIEERR